MKTRILAACAAAALLFSNFAARAADPSSSAEELKALVSKIQGKLKEGKKTEADLSAEIKAFDDLLAKYKADKTDDTARILLMKAMLYLEVFDNTDKGVALVKELKQDYPDTKAGKDADGILENVKKSAEAKKIRAALVDGAKFPDFEEKDLNGKPLSVANYKGKVVLVDFWATWCGPCVRELPNVLKAYENNHSKGFEIIGISLDEDEQKLKNFIKEKNMPWPQYFDGKGWGSKLAAKYGVQSIPATYLLDGDGKIIGANLRGEALDAAVTKALGQK